MIIWLIPVISAFIGWLTNWIAIEMLFRPKHPVNLGFFKWQGIFPKNQAEIAVKIGNMVATELLTPADVKAIALSGDQMTKVRKLIDEKLENYLNTTFQANHPILATFFSDKRKNALKQEMLDEAEKITPQLIHQFMGNVESKLDISAIIRDRVATLEVDKLEQLLMSILAKEFRFVEILGGVIGFFIGLLQVVITHFS